MAGSDDRGDLIADWTKLPKVKPTTKLDKLLSKKNELLENTEKDIEDIEAEGDQLGRLPNLKLKCNQLQKQVNILTWARLAYASTKREIKVNKPTETHLWSLVSNPNLKLDKDIGSQVWEEVNDLLNPLLDDPVNMEESNGLRQRFKSG